MERKRWKGLVFMFEEQLNIPVLSHYEKPRKQLKISLQVLQGYRFIAVLLG